MNLDNIFRKSGFSFHTTEIQKWKKIFLKAEERSIAVQDTALCTMEYDPIKEQVTFIGPSYFYFYLGQETINYEKVSSNREQ